MRTTAHMKPSCINILRTWLFRRHMRLLIIVSISLVSIIIILLHLKERKDRTSIDVLAWKKDKTIFGDGNFIGYGKEFAHLKNAVVDPKHPDEFGLDCEKGLPSYSFLFGKEGTHLADWMTKLYQAKPDDTMNVHTQTTFAVLRYEAHNLYHTMTDWYNVVLVCEIMDIDPKMVDILLLDERPPGLMDDTWDHLFRNVFRASKLKRKTVFKNLIWNVLGYESPLNFHMLNRLPFAHDFYTHFVTSFGASTEKKLDCSNLNISIVWRRDYMSHPERKDISGGLIHRKFKNEDEILKVVRDTLPGHNVHQLVLEEMSMKEQIDIISQTDILIGMHGAGVAHAMFLPGHGAVFETFPNYWPYLLHFKAFCRWRKLRYSSWRNEDPNNEFPDFYTYIPPAVIIKNLLDLYQGLCSTDF